MLSAAKLLDRDPSLALRVTLIHGWSQSTAMYKHQLAGLSDQYRVITLGLRGHGESDKPAHGYRTSRLAKDVYDALTELDLQNVNLLGWSMGCSVIWSYLDLFGIERLRRLILGEGGAHVMFLEAPERFNHVVRNFLRG